LTAVVPTHAAGTVHITVTIAGGTSSTSSADQFVYSAASTPTATVLSLASTPTTGGSTLVIFGTDFTGASAVQFGDTDALSFTVLSDTAILATAPAGVAGATHVHVTTVVGTSASASGNAFTYLSNVWTGHGGDDDWNNAANWSLG